MKKVLIANRGEIAVRVVRACRDYGVQSVAVYANADIDALHTRMADEAYGLDGDRPADTYLHMDKLLAIAKKSGADAVHPGYGFLSESAAFAQAVIDAGLAWIGPSPLAIARLGDKVQARKIALKVGAPLVAGTSEPVTDAAEVLQFAEQHGLPIIIKAAFGGGGRGMKIAWRMDEVAELYASAVREALAAFGRGECFVEQFLDQPRHIEAQVIGDQHGKVVVLGTRDCSLQRRNQKLVEEAPAPFLSDAQRARIHQAAHDICAEVGYASAGTVEFLLSGSGAISFLEVNTRLQVEHPVTEQTTGLDLVVEQLRVADGLPLSINATPAPLGHAIEFRINAEDVGRGFLPTPGPVQRFEVPGGPGVRVDTGVLAGSTVPGSFDSLMAKLIVTGSTREQALARAPRAGRVPDRGRGQRAAVSPRRHGACGFHRRRWVQGAYALDRNSLRQRPGRCRARRAPARRLAAALRHRDRRPPHAAGPAGRAAAGPGRRQRRSQRRHTRRGRGGRSQRCRPHRRQSARLEGAGRRRGASRRCHRHHGGHEDGDAGHGAPRRPHRTAGGGGQPPGSGGLHRAHCLKGFWLDALVYQALEAMLFLSL